MFGIEVYQLWPQDGPFWWRDDETGEPELYESREEAVRASDLLMYREDLTGYSFRAVRYEEGQGG